MPDRPAWKRWSAMASASVALLALWAALRGDWLDDAFITFRYAQNLAHGLGPVFNPGEAVEGYTSFLWMLVTAIPFTLGGQAFALYAIEAIGFALACLVIWRMLLFPGPDGADRVRFTTGVLAVGPVFLINAVDGMETVLFSALLLESARAMVRPPTLRAGGIVGLLSAATILTRPEALPLLAVWPAWHLLLRRPGAGPWLSGFLAGAVPPVVAHLAFRISFYGEPFPNTFYAKATGALGPRLDAGLADLGTLVVQGTGNALPPLWLWFGLAFALAGLFALRRGSKPELRLWLAALWTVVGFRAAFQLYSGGEAMGTFRFLAPALPALFVLADEAFGGRKRLRLTERPLALTLVVLAAASALYSTMAFWETRAVYRQGLAHGHVALGKWLAESRPPASWLAIGDAGAVPFYSRLPTIDLWGLNDATIARLPGEYGKRAGVADYALAREPDIVVLWNLKPIREGEILRVLGAQTFDREIAEHPVFARDYRFVREFAFREMRGGRPNGYYLDVFERRPDLKRSPPPDPES